MSQLLNHPKVVVIQEDIPESAVSGLAEFIDRYYMSSKIRFIEEGSYNRTENQREGIFVFSWKERMFAISNVANSSESSLAVSLKVSQPEVVVSFDDLSRDDQSQLSLCSRIVDEIQNIVWTYLENTKMSSLYFVLGSSTEEKHSESPEEGKNAQRNILKRILSGNTTNMFLLFLVFSFVLSLFAGNYTVILLIAFQLVYLFYSDRIVLNLGNVHPTEERPSVAIVSVRSTKETLKFLGTMGRETLSEIREQVGRLVIPSVASSITSSMLVDVKTSITAILSRNGIKVSSNDIEVKTRNVYNLVKNVAGRFNQPVPKIVIANSLVSNASATGISAKHSSIMITAGSLEDLTENELDAVVGHELGHVKGHDPVILFGVTTIVYVGGFYLWYPLLQFLGIFYYVLAFAVIYAVGKVLETRADTESASHLQNAGELASALTQIGFRQLFHEKYNPVVKLFDWFRFDPHPPIYFRVARLSKMAGGEAEIRHTFLLSLRDCLIGFLSVFY